MKPAKSSVPHFIQRPFPNEKGFVEDWKHVKWKGMWIANVVDCFLKNDFLKFFFVNVTSLKGYNSPLPPSPPPPISTVFS